MAPHPSPAPGPQAPKDAARRRVALAIGGVVAAILFLAMIGQAAPKPETVKYPAFLSMVAQDQVDAVVVHSNSLIEIHVKSAKPGKQVRTTGPAGGIPDSDIGLLDDHHVARTYVTDHANVWAGLLAYLLPFAFIAGLWYWMSRSTRRQLGGAAFGRTKAQVGVDRPTTRFSDIAGYDGVKTEINEVVDFLKDAGKFTAIGARIPKGVLLVGPPGTGKTLFAKAVAGEADVPFLSITGSAFMEMFVGVGAARVRDLFANARKQTPSIVFVDEIDAIGRKRGIGVGGGHEEREQTLNQLLAEMDGFESTEGIVVLAATNRPDVLDPALLRAGRFDRQVVVPLPTQDERAAILAVHARGKKLAEDVDLDVVARGTPGMSGAELANLLNEAALITVRRGAEAITGPDVDAARDRVLIGVKRPSLALDSKERELVAYHEAGHALLANLLPGADPVHKVTILPTGMALGVTEQLPAEEHLLRQRHELEAVIAVSLGGRIAEELCFGSPSTGAEDDLVRGTELARRMVRQWGMADALGYLAWAPPDAGFLGEGIGRERDYGERTADLVDQETERILEQAAGEARSALASHRAALDALAAALVERETLTGEEVEAIVVASHRPALAS